MRSFEKNEGPTLPFNGKGIVFSRQGVSLIKGGSNTFIHDIVLGENYIVFHDRAVSLKGVSTVQYCVSSRQDVSFIGAGTPLRFVHMKLSQFKGGGSDTFLDDFLTVLLTLQRSHTTLLTQSSHKILSKRDGLTHSPHRNDLATISRPF